MIQPIRIRVTALIECDGKLLLIRCHDDDVGLHYNLPGGGLEYGEALQDALRRELQEEACVDIEIGSLVLLIQGIQPDDRKPKGVFHWLGLCFRCNILNGGNPRMSDDPDEYQTGVEWIEIERLTEIPLLPQIGATIQAVMLGEIHEQPLIVLPTSPHQSTRLID